MSREHFILYDPATGAELARGTVPAGKVSQQARDDAAALCLPKSAMRGPLEDHVEQVRAAMLIQTAQTWADPALGRPVERLKQALTVEADIDGASDLRALLSIDPRKG